MYNYDFIIYLNFIFQVIDILILNVLFLIYENDKYLMVLMVCSDFFEHLKDLMNFFMYNGSFSDLNNIPILGTYISKFFMRLYLMIFCISGLSHGRCLYGKSRDNGLYARR